MKQYTKLFEMDGVQLIIEDDTLQAIADKALERKTGARASFHHGRVPDGCYV